MKLWEVKAQALRLMFADTDLNFNATEFEDGTLMANGNTREKLIRMNDSIRRAVDLYFHYVGEGSFFDVFMPDDLGEISSPGSPTRVDALIYSDETTLLRVKNQINFFYDAISGKVLFPEDTFPIYTKFRVWYKLSRNSMPPDEEINDMTYDLLETKVPSDVQRKIAYYVKGELYEEDEPEQAFRAKQEYVSFLVEYKKPFNRVQTRVAHAKVFDL